MLDLQQGHFSDSLSDGLSKVYGLSILRCGWVLAPIDIATKIREAWIDIENVGSRLTESLSARVLERIDEFDAHWRRILDMNRPIMNEFLKETQESGHVNAFVPEHGCICFPELLIDRPKDFVAMLEKKQKVYVGDGSKFGGSHKRHIRIGFGHSPDTLQEGLDIIRQELGLWR